MAAMTFNKTQKVLAALNEAKAELETVRGPTDKCEEAFAAILSYIEIVEIELETMFLPAREDA